MSGSIYRAVNAALPSAVRGPLWRGLVRLAAELRPPASYNHDGLRVYGRNTEWLTDPRFADAYRLGMNSGHKILRERGSAVDIHIEWRVYLACWAAAHAAHLPGDFVECGVNTGICSLTICRYIDFNATGKNFYLFDTFCGIPESQMLPAERERRTRENTAFYEECYDVAKQNFAPFPKAVLVRGLIPDTLTAVPIDRVAYLHIDMNIAKPEVDAAEFFWDKLVTGAPILLDDYGFDGYEEQRRAMDAFAKRRGVQIATLPTGQGLMIKP